MPADAFPLYQGKSEAEIERFGVFYTEAQKVVDSKQLRPAIRTQYMRTAFQIPFDSTVRVSLDTNLVMIKENPTDGPTCHATGRCIPPQLLCPVLMLISAAYQVWLNCWVLGLILGLVGLTFELSFYSIIRGTVVICKSTL